MERSQRFLQSNGMLLDLQTAQKKNSAALFQYF